MSGNIAQAPTNYSTTLSAGAGVAGTQVLIPKLSFNEAQEVFIANPNTTGNIFFNPWGAPAGAGLPGSIGIPPLSGWSGRILPGAAGFTVQGASGAAVTAGTR